MPPLRRALSTGCNSPENVRKSPEQDAACSLPQSANQVLTPISVPIVQPHAIATSRPMTILYMPSLACDFTESPGASTASTFACGMLFVVGAEAPGNASATA